MGCCVNANDCKQGNFPFLEIDGRVDNSATAFCRRTPISAPDPLSRRWPPVRTLSSPERAPTVHIDAREYLIAPAIRADFAIVAARSADYARNLVYSLTARNFNPLMAMAADVVIAETNEIVPLGVLPPDAIQNPRLFQLPQIAE